MHAAAGADSRKPGDAGLDGAALAVLALRSTGKLRCAPQPGQPQTRPLRWLKQRVCPFPSGAVRLGMGRRHEGQTNPGWSGSQRTAETARISMKNKSCALTPKHAWINTARASVAPQSRGSPSLFLWLPERSDAGAQSSSAGSRRQTRFFGDFLAANKKDTRPSVRQTDLCR